MVTGICQSWRAIWCKKIPGLFSKSWLQAISKTNFGSRSRRIRVSNRRAYGGHEDENDDNNGTPDIAEQVIQTGLNCFSVADGEQQDIIRSVLNPLSLDISGISVEESNTARSLFSFHWDFSIQVLLSLYVTHDGLLKFINTVCTVESCKERTPSE